MAKPEGTIASPATSTERPNAYPVPVGICSCWVVMSMFTNIAMQMKNEARLVSSTGLFMEVRRSTIGWLARSWSGIQAASRASARASRPRTSGLVQPQLAPLDTASRAAVRMAERTSAPAMSKRPGVVSLDSFTSSRMPMRNTTPSAAETQNSDSHPKAL
jgi:hypothetical protein